MAQFSNYLKAGFGTSLGFAMTILIGVLLFLPGYIIVTRENKKVKSDRNTGTLVLGFILMFVGVALGFGIFSGDALNALSNQF
jgi:uncharacterized membrane protein HdeD (DUF308 family)